VANLAKTIREIEIKLRISDVPDLLQRLRGLGARVAVRVFEQNILYDTPNSDFRVGGKLLRLRIETPAPDTSSRYLSRAFQPGKSRAILTSKVPVADAQPDRFKEKLETEVTVPDPAAWRRAAQAVGLREDFRYEKYRTSFRFGGTHLELDETPVGIFLEVEGPRSSIDRVTRMLGFAPREYIRGTYWDLYAADCRRRGRKTKNMLFDA
jgi:adenylate cyclase class 2